MRKRVLLLCTGNSGRSIMAEALTRKMRGHKWEAFSAGAKPKGVNPNTLAILREDGVDTEGLRSKGVGEFEGRKFDLVVTLCDSAAETCPFFPGAEKQAHLAFEDPDAAAGSQEEILDKFREVRDAIGRDLIKLLDDFY